MAIREYKCEGCGLLTEKIIATNLTPDPTIKCPRCSELAQFKAIPSSFGLLTDNFSQQKMDVAIGKDADRRWEDINTRQATRDRVRQQSGQMGLTMVGRNEFAPVPEATKALRTEAAAALSETGYKPGFDSDSDKKVVGGD